MSIKVAIIEGEQVIADIKELIDPEDKQRQYMFTNPFRIILQPTMTLMEEGSEEPLENTSQVSLATWQALTVDSTFIVNPNSMTTLFEPVADLKKMYQEITDAS